jgi:DNA ligase-associated metallophosphoesterase
MTIRPLLAPRRIAFHGQCIELRPSGALFFPERALLAVADLHLGKALHHSAQGQFLPPYEAEATLEKLDHELQATGAREILSLGDAFHSARLTREPGFLPRMIELMSRRARPIFVTGNHDRALAQALAALTFALHDEWRFDAATSLTLRHQPDTSGEAQIFGHLHPCATLSTRAGRQRRPCFIVGEAHLVMPSFGALTGGLDVGAGAIAPYARNADLYLL